MKLLTLALTLLTLSANAQTVDGVELDDFNAEYIKIAIVKKILSRKVKIAVDYGQPLKFLPPSKEILVLNKDGSKVIWNGEIDAINWFSHNGYEPWLTYTIEAGGVIYVYYILKRSR